VARLNSQSDCVISWSSTSIVLCGLSLQRHVNRESIMSDFIKLGVLRPDGTFVTVMSRFEFIQPKIMTAGFLQGDPAYTDLLAPNAEPGGDQNVPSAGGYILIDCIEGKIFDWQSEGDLNFIAQENLGFGKDSKRVADLRRQFIRPFIVGARYYTDFASDDPVVHKFKPCETDRQLRKLMEKFAYDGLGRTLFYKPSIPNFVYYEVDMPAWELEKLSRSNPSSLARLRSEIEARCTLSETDVEVWDEMQAEIQDALDAQREWSEFEAVLYPNGVPGP
jgi:hypothetical protein